MKYNSNEAILERLETIVREWKGLFENPPAVNLSFAVSANGKLQLNGLEICDMAEIDPEKLAYDFEVINLGPVWIVLEWPYEGKPRLLLEREIPAA